MDAILRPFVEEQLKSRLKAAYEHNKELANALHDEEVIHALGDCGHKMDSLFVPNGSQSMPLLLIVEDSEQIIHQIDQYQEQLSKKIKNNSPVHTKEIRDKARQSVEEAKELLGYCRRQHHQQQDVCDTGNRHEEEEAFCDRLRQEMKEEIKSPCRIYTDMEFLNHLDRWICKLDMPAAGQTCISPELARKFLEKLSGDVRRLSVTPQNPEGQQAALANMLQIREALFSMQTALLNRVKTERQAVFSK